MCRCQVPKCPALHQGCEAHPTFLAGEFCNSGHAVCVACLVLGHGVKKPLIPNDTISRLRLYLNWIQHQTGPKQAPPNFNRFHVLLSACEAGATLSPNLAHRGKFIENHAQIRDVFAQLHAIDVPALKALPAPLKRKEITQAVKAAMAVVNEAKVRKLKHEFEQRCRMDPHDMFCVLELQESHEPEQAELTQEQEHEQHVHAAQVQEHVHAAQVQEHVPGPVIPSDVPVPGYRGLTNTDQWICFANAVYQLICRVLLPMLSPPLPTQPVLHELHRLSALLHTTGPAVSLHDFPRLWPNTLGQFRNRRQACAKEFLQAVLTALQDEDGFFNALACVCGFEPVRTFQCGCEGGHTTLLEPAVILEVTAGPYAEALASHLRPHTGPSVICPNRFQATQTLSFPPPPCLIVSGQGAISPTLLLHGHMYAWAGAVQFHGVDNMGHCTAVFPPGVVIDDDRVQASSTTQAVLVMYTRQ